MRIAALVLRILRQFIRDKRTMALMLAAPLLILTLVDLVFNGENYVPNIGLVSIPTTIEDKMLKEGAHIQKYGSEKDAVNDLEQQNLDGYLLFQPGRSGKLVLEGSDPAINGVVMKWSQDALKPLQPSNIKQKLKIAYFHGKEELRQFDYFGPVLLGFFAFFFVFLVAGISFLRERTTGTLGRLMASPLRRWEIVAGYVIGFGIFTMLQAVIIALYAIYVLDMAMYGAFGYVLLITLLLSLSALTLGILLSAFAQNEFQMMQFIPIVIVPQLFFSGLFNLETISEWLRWIGLATPLYYGAEALRDVMVRGNGWDEIYGDILILAGFSALFISLNIIALKKYRKA
ncbi:ABC transporter permease [Mesobacillus zeae]|uniref:ABC transporter permease n=1 Tax=Mesobacillus zeae TaxID=1917180 RepID=A0A398BAH1_9BACI|nr:ABC transporter permease [Mesobacillus zeae]RID86817.1 ABC transporter permease [Mesobacillus zeae]